MDEKNQHLPAGKHRINGEKASREKGKNKKKKKKCHDSQIGTEKLHKGL